ncbi:mucin-5AC-like isoform X2, partial [Silurus asotus]
QVNITRNGCGTTKLCMSSVSGCDPSGNSSCFFSSTQLNNTILTVELSGTTLGYVALGLT